MTKEKEVKKVKVVPIGKVKKQEETVLIPEEVEDFVPPNILVIDLVSKKQMLIEIYEEHSSIKIGKEVVNITKEQVYAILEAANEIVKNIGGKQDEN